MTKKDAQKKKVGPVKRTLNVAVIVFLIYFGVVLLFENVSFLNRYQHYVIVSGSMEPTIDAGDVVFINKSVSVDELEEGDIIAFDAVVNNQDIVVVHYVYSITENPGGYTIATIAEDAEDPDDWILTEDDIIGQYLFRLPRVGRFLLFAQSTTGRIVIIIDIILIYLIYRMFFKKTPKKGGEADG